VVIYADILLAVNWWIDFLLLLGVQRAAGVRTRSWRLVLGAFLGALSCCVLFLPPMSALLSIAVKFAAAAVMVSVAFRWHGIRRFVKLLLLLFGLSAGLSGVSAALYYFAAPRGFYVFNGVVYYAVSPWLLIGLTLLCYGVLWAIEKVSARRAPIGRSFILRIANGGRSAQVHCLYDSGNHLVEPFSNCPVLVVERGALEGIVSIPEDVEDLPPNGRWRVVPFDSLGGNGLLPAFFADHVTAILPRGERALESCYVAVCERLGRGEYDGLIGSALGDQLIE
jgi:stage II sporulation protein GA (sporulation sigma-E factor processing peptidase)